MVLTLYLVERIARGIQKVLVRRNDCAVGFKLDDGLKLINRGQFFPGIVGAIHCL